jgi:NAD(P)-dependent dehydrogenase (short-subunit alcohol dehydrogenase family)
MVNLKDIRNSNRALQYLPPGLVAVFAGATSGIGLATLKQFAKYANGPRAYIIGRSKENAAHIIDQLKIINPMGTFVFIEGQISLIKEVDRIFEEIEKLENYVDILCMSPGYLSLGGRHGSSIIKPSKTSK